MGQQTFTSWSKMICEELECDWSKVRAEYASVNRHFRENKLYRRMATNASAAVRSSREYLQQAGASARGEDSSEKFLRMAHAALDEPGAQVIVKKATRKRRSKA